LKLVPDVWKRREKTVNAHTTFYGYQKYRLNLMKLPFGGLSIDTDHFLRLQLIFVIWKHPPQGLFKPSISGLLTVRSTSERAATGT